MRRKEEIDLYGQAGALIFEKLWLKSKAGTHFVLEREKAQTDTDRILCFSFLIPS